VQLNYGEPELRKAMCGILRKIAGMVDGVRCDVAMLVEQELLKSTWGLQLAPERDPSLEVTSEFWPAACHEARAVNSDFIFLAESYWEREKALMDKGFDYCYDKVMYDRIVQADGEGVDGLLDIHRGYQDKLVRFLENHDEERAATVFANVAQHIAAAVLTLTSPGLHFVHDGQQAGRTRRVSMHITCRLPEDEDVQDKSLKERYKKLLTAVNGAAIRNGAWERCHAYIIHEDGSQDVCKREYADAYADVC
jgi:glycosidase